MTAWLLCAAAALLSVERITYILIWRDPDAFRSWSRQRTGATLRGPVDLLVLLFVGFKVIQIAVFIGWHLMLGDGTWLPHSREPRVVATGALLVALGQGLNLSVFKRLGKIGVFYGNKFGHSVLWCQQFPFTWFDHPQYVGTVLAIWGFFLLMRFPAPDWMLVPLLETVYYAAGARLEQDPVSPGSLKRRWR